MQTLLDVLVREHGDEYRQLIYDAIAFLRDHEYHWRLKKPLDKIKFIESVLAHIKGQEDAS